MLKKELEQRVKDLEDALRPFAEQVQYELSDPQYPPGSMGYHNETEEPDSMCVQMYAKHGEIRKAARLLGIPIPKFDLRCLEKVPKYCPEPINHDHHLNMYCRSCGELHCHKYYGVKRDTDPDLTYYTCLGCAAVCGYSSNQGGR